MVLTRKEACERCEKLQIRRNSARSDQVLRTLTRNIQAENKPRPGQREGLLELAHGE
jgi:hypothetical protein